MMPKFRRKADSAIVTAEQYTGPWSVPTNEVLPDIPGVEFFKIDQTDQRYPFFGKPRVRLHPGDWLITGPDGARWGLYAYLFTATYEPLEQP